MTDNKKERSRAYPVMALEEALGRIENINKNLGLNGKFNRESIAVGMGYSSLSGASARAVAALVQYGLLDREKDQYYLSALSKKYLLPLDDNDKQNATRIAALSPSLFGEIFAAFKGQVIPRQFTNRLVHEFGIQQKAAPDVERIFRTTMETAGLLNRSGILSGEAVQQGETSASSPDDLSDAELASDDANTELSKGEDSTMVKNYLSVKLPSGLLISYPQELASAFAFGQFGQKLKELDDAVGTYAQSLIKKEAGDE